MRITTVLRATGMAVCGLAAVAALAAPPTAPVGSGGSPQWAPPHFMTSQGTSPWTPLQGATPQWTMPAISLSGDDALARLRVSNPRHYAIAVQILAAADEICDATKASPVPAKFDAEDIDCAQGLWLTSYPPRRYLQFRIEDTAYSALVVVRIAAPKLEGGPLTSPAP
ncbi:MAG TPA: hypothetical protein VIY90_08125 [Steroidobacteraceae bacterium]